MLSDVLLCLELGSCNPAQPMPKATGIPLANHKKIWNTVASGYPVAIPHAKWFNKTTIVNLVNLKSPQSICSCYCFLIPAPGPRTYNYNQLQYLRLDLCLAPAHGISLGKSEATLQLWLMLVMLPNMKTRSVLLQKLYIDIKYVRLITKPDLLFAASLFRNLHGVLAARHVAAWTMGHCDWWEMNQPSTPAGTNHA